MVNVVTIARIELLRLLRDRSNLFFVFVFPLLLVVLIGASFGGSMESRIGVIAPDGDAAAASVVDRIEAADGITTVEVDGDGDDLRGRVSRNELAAGLVFPDDFAAALERGDPIELGYLSRPAAAAMSMRAVVDAAVADQSATATAASAAAEHTGRPFSEMLGAARLVARGADGVDVVTQEVGSDELAQEFAGLGQFDLGASSQLLLFTFLTALSGGAALIQTRELGVARRMASTATPMRHIVLGQAAGRVLIAATQAAYIVLATVLLFRVNWGQPLATAAVLGLFCLLSGGAGMLLGATASNDSQAAGVGVGLGLGLAALGGSMVPLEIFPETMRTIAHVTPHAWANQAMGEIVRRDGGLSDVLLELGVLAGFAAVLLALATWRLRVVLTR